MADVVDIASSPREKRVVLPVFEGPLDLLLHLVKINEMDVTEIEISSITRQYMEYLLAMEALDLDIAGDFLVMAATLLTIKARAILPRSASEEEAPSGPEEEIDEILSTKDLIRRLVEYRKFKDYAATLRSLESANNGVFYRADAVTHIPGFEKEIPRQDIRALFDAFVSILKKVRIEARHTVMRERFTVDEKMLEVRELIRRDRQVNVTRVFANCVSKEEVICFFLALLELARMREITVAQAGTYEDILIAPWDENVVYVG